MQDLMHVDNKCLLSGSHVGKESLSHPNRPLQTYVGLTCEIGQERFPTKLQVAYDSSIVDKDVEDGKLRKHIPVQCLNGRWIARVTPKCMDSR